MFKITAKDQRGERIFACGTPDQALDKADELTGRGMMIVTIVDPAGREWSLADFRREHD